MDKSSDFGALLKKYEKKHKSKPSQFESVAGGLKKRLEANLKLRKSSRLTTFDSGRNLSDSNDSKKPAAVSNAKHKVDHRRQQLEKWKEEKEKKKKDAAAKKKKPFLAGVPHNSLKFELPPPTKVMPSTSGRVTRSQAARNKKNLKSTKPSEHESFAPKDAIFHAPLIKNLKKMPKLAPINTLKDKKAIVSLFNFEPDLSHTVAKTEAKQLRSRIYTKQLPADTRITRSVVLEARAKGNTTKCNTKTLPKYLQNSSSSENECHSVTQSTSSSSQDFTANIVSSSSDSDIVNNQSSCTENNSAKSLQSSSSSDLESEKKSPILKTKSREPNSAKHMVTKLKSPRRSKTPGKSSQTSTRKLKSCSPKTAVPKSESSSEEKLRSPKSPQPEQTVEESRNVSPFVTMSRGKTNARKETRKKLEEGLLDEDASDIDNVDHFRRQLASEMKRITEMCEIWDKIYEKVELAEALQEIRGCVGQARLLMSQRLQQFGALVERCARPDPATPLVTPADLHGFWDMVFMQVVDVDMRFKKLVELQARDWVAEAPRPTRARAPRAVRARATAAPSRLKDIIAAARKAKKQEPPAASADDRTFEAGFFSVRSPARSPTCSPTRSPHTPANKHSLLKAVLSSEANKASASKKSASFAMLRASGLGKNLECEGIAPLPPTPLPEVNMSATPGRSILKSSQLTKTPRSIKVVLFVQSDNEIDNSPINHKENIADGSTDNALPMDSEKDSAKKDYKNSRRKSRLTRQDAVTEGPTTRSQHRKSMLTPETAEKSPKKSGRKKKVLEEVDNNVDYVEEKTPKRSTRSRRSVV